MQKVLQLGQNVPFKINIANKPKPPINTTMHVIYVGHTVAKSSSTSLCLLGAQESHMHQRLTSPCFSKPGPWTATVASLGAC